MFRNQFFIGSTYGFAALQRSLNECIRRIGSAHYFHYDLDLRIVGDHFVIMNNLFLYRISREISQVKYILDVDLFSCFFIDAFLVPVDHFHHTGSHCAVA